MRIALSTPMRWATGLAAVATLAIFATRPRAIEPPRVGCHLEADHATRAGLSQLERELDALTDRVTSAVDTLRDAQTDTEIQAARAELERLQAEVEVERQLVTERARQLRISLAR